MQVSVTRKNTRFLPDLKRVIARFFYTNPERSRNLIRKILDLSEEEAGLTLNKVLRNYSKRHRNISRVFENHFARVQHHLAEMEMDASGLDPVRKALIGSYFTMEYSIESAAFFNPSVVEDLDQSGLSPGEKRLIMSFRATGEGHISSIVFRSLVIDRKNNLTVEPPGRMLVEAEHIRHHRYDKASFRVKLQEMQRFSNILPPSLVFDKLGDTFTYEELKRALNETKKSIELTATKELLLNEIIWLARSHYDIDFSLDTALSERVIFPIEETEKKGVEDARFVRFTEDDGKITFYATYTAYDGMNILPKMIETKNFYHFKILPIHGSIAQNKGMALFPKKIKGKYAMLCRIDGVNNYIAFSDRVNIWRSARMIQQPKYPWELIQVGNCGSPIETREGWLVLIHGVGPMREYVIGASLYDLDNPEKLIGRLKTPLMVPNDEEREGYVPNVIYSCGGIIHNESLIIPYAMSDYASTYASVNLKELLDELKKNN